MPPCQQAYQAYGRVAFLRLEKAKRIKYTYMMQIRNKKHTAAFYYYLKLKNRSKF